MAKTKNQCSDYAQKGPGLAYKPRKSPTLTRAKIPSPTIATSANSHKRGKQG